MAGDTGLEVRKTPLLLLKTKSAPTDAYEEYFSAFDDGKYEPVFVPVLEHRFKQDALSQVRQYIVNGDFASIQPGVLPKYGAMIFTSQRAVEAFAQIIESVRKESPRLLESCLPKRTPLYVVGPATARGLKSLNLHCPVVGEETGNGQALASFILEDYNKLYEGVVKPHILFLVGEKRRDVIPKTLQSQDLPSGQRSVIHELEIYETGEMHSFKSDFSSIWRENAKAGKSRQWVVVFSPTGCKAMLESLGLLDYETKRVTSNATASISKQILIATIGPTTRDYLVEEFGFTPDACAEKPSPEGIAESLRSFHQRLG
ncbi:uroporphyrinogen-III synthase [Kalmusia sp. IMI 367209]|nr:uroporphyrinogen-III synthase [Kalmusia sp. IMI 367209]